MIPMLLFIITTPLCAACYISTCLCLTRSCVERRCAGSGAAIEPPPCAWSVQSVILHMRNSSVHAVTSLQSGGTLVSRSART